MARIASIQPRKQRKFRYNAPIHVRGAFLHATLADDLRKKYGKRSFRVVTGDTVKVLRGEFAGDVPRPIDPSKVMITKLNLKDAKRVARLEVKA